MTRATTAAAALIAWFSNAHTAAPPKPEPPPYAFDMCITHDLATTAAAHLSWNDAVLSGVVRTLSGDERDALEGTLREAATRWEAKANPMLEDLEGGDPDAPIAAWFKTAPSFVRTAQISAKVRACAPDGFCALPRARGAECPSSTAAPTSAAEADRARFVLWAWGHALRFRAASPEAAREGAAALRERVRTSHVIAVVMTAEDAELTKVAPFATMRERWGQVRALRRIAQHEKHEKSLAVAADVSVDEGPNEVIVLPRFDAIADNNPDAIIESEVAAAAPQLRR